MAAMGIAVALLALAPALWNTSVMTGLFRLSDKWVCGANLMKPTAQTYTPLTAVLFLSTLMLERSNGLVLDCLVAFQKVSAPLGVGTALVSFPFYVHSKHSILAASKDTTGRSILQRVGRALAALIGRSKKVFGGVEVTQIPSTYVADGDTREEAIHRAEMFYQIVRAVRMSGIPFGFMLKRTVGKLRLIYLTYAEDTSELRNRVWKLHNILSSSLKGFTLTTHNELVIDEQSPRDAEVTAYLDGPLAPVQVGQEAADGLTIAIGYLRSIGAGSIQVLVEPARPSRWKLNGLKRDFEYATGRASRTVSHTGGGLLRQNNHESVTFTDIDASNEAKDLTMQIRRHEATDACKASISVTCEEYTRSIAEQCARDILAAIMGRVRPSSERTGLSIKTKKNNNTLRALANGRQPPNWTLMVPEEIVPVMVIPPIDLGLEVVNRARFVTGKTQSAENPPAETPRRRTTPPQGAGRFSLGSELDESGAKVGPVHFALEDMVRHVEVFGDTGSGKTSTVKRILSSVNGSKIPFLVLTPTLTDDYVSLADKIPSLRFFTPGDEQTAPLRFNPHEFSEGVLVNTILADVKAAYIASAPSIGIVREYTEMCIDNSFERCQYDRDHNDHGHAVLMSDLLDSVVHLECDVLEYSDRQNQDLIGALRGRFRSLMSGPLYRVFNTLTGMTVEELVSAPTIIALDGLSADERALFASLLVVNVARYFQAKALEMAEAKPLQFLLVLEEAHHFLVRTGERSVDEEHAARSHAIRSIVEVLRESRRNGLGVVILDQLPSSLDEHAMSLPVTTILHRLSTGVDRRTIAMKLDLNEEQLKMVGSLPVGHAIAKFAGDGQPMYISVHPPPKRVPVRAGTKTSLRDWVRERMAQVYKEYPAISVGLSNPFVFLETSESPTGASVEIDLRVAWNVVSFARSDFLVKNYIPFLRRKKIILLTKLAELLWVVLERITGDSISEPFVSLFLQVLRPDNMEESEAARHEILVDELWAHFGRRQLDFQEQLYEERITVLLKVVDEYSSHVDRRISIPFRDIVQEELALLKKKWNASEVAEQEEAPTAQPTEQDLDAETQRFFLAAIETHSFSSMYYESLREAVDGDFGKIRRMLIRFAEKFGPEGCNAHHVAKWLFERAVVILDAPQDVLMAESIRRAIQGTA